MNEIDRNVRMREIMKKIEIKKLEKENKGKGEIKMNNKTEKWMFKKAEKKKNKENKNK